MNFIKIDRFQLQKMIRRKQSFLSITLLGTGTAPYGMVKPNWKICEDSKKQQDRERGCRIIPTGIGSDYLRLCPNEKPTFVEVKDGCHSISKLQNETRRFVKKIGFDYKVERCGCDW